MLVFGQHRENGAKILGMLQDMGSKTRHSCDRRQGIVMAISRFQIILEAFLIFYYDGEEIDLMTIEIIRFGLYTNWPSAVNSASTISITIQSTNKVWFEGTTD